MSEPVHGFPKGVNLKYNVFRLDFLSLLWDKFGDELYQKWRN